MRNIFRQSFFHSVPLIVASEVSECGLTCVAMIAGFHGRKVGLAELRRDINVSIKGTNAKQLLDIGRSLGLMGRAVKVELQHMGALRLPCVLHWGLHHFVVLERVKRGRAVILDPSIGRRSVNADEMSAHFTGVAIEFSPGFGFAPAHEAQAVSLLDLIGSISGLGKSAARLAFLAVCMEACALVLPFFPQWVIDFGIAGSDYSFVSLLAIGCALLLCIQVTLSLLRGWLVAAIGVDVNYQWLMNVCSHLLSLPISYFERRHLGDVMSRFGSVNAIQRVLTTTFVESAIDGVLVLGTLAVMLALSPRLACVSLIAIGLYALARFAIHRKQMLATNEQILHSAIQQTHLLETIRGIQTIRVFGRESERIQHWANFLADQMNAELGASKLTAIQRSLLLAVAGAERLAAIYLGALAVIDAGFTLGTFFAYLALREQFASRAAALVDRSSDYRTLRLHAERLADIALTEPESRRHGGPELAPSGPPSLELRNVSLGYSTFDPRVLNDVSLLIRPGECVAISGPSGCGKTTLAKVLLGLLDPSEGRVLVDGVDLAQVGLGAYRAVVGAVMQEDTLFRGSILENITFFDSAPEMRRVAECATMAAIHDDILQMPMQYMTLVGDMGTALSGGQRQRILLARALYKRPRILILDEATSHLDVLNEEKVNAAVRKLDLTRIVIAHRRETIESADRHIALDRGRIVSDTQKFPRNLSKELA